ncbi:MAG: diguanylate cyclase [Defluviitaleaceae bacterium]|nr:diguanylate cyclase [Defluviitaleaceae bacterium]
MKEYLDDKQRERVLIVDDTPAHLRSLSRILTELYDVVIAKTGEEALEMVTKTDIDLILLDLVLPGISGFEVLAKLKINEETKRIPVIFITSSDSPEDEMQGLALGAADYIRKPFIDIIVKMRIALQMQLIQQMRIIESYGFRDGLTGVNNRRSFDQMIGAEWARAVRNKEPLGMLLLDIDYFKKFNDTYGHLNGDACLKTVAHIMRDSVKRGGDFVFRWGGEEFAILLPNTHICGTVAVAEQIRKNIENAPIKLDSGDVYVTISIGAGAIIPQNEMQKTEFKEFYEYIDKALYKAKANGRNRVETICGFGQKQECD